MPSSHGLHLSLLPLMLPPLLLLLLLTIALQAPVCSG
jgi:hypothetical protein